MTRSSRSIAASRSAIRSRCAAPVRTAVRRSGEAMNASSKWASWASSPRLRPRLRWTSPRSGSSRPAARRRSVVLPAPFGPTSPIRSPSAIDASIESRMTNVPTSRVTPDRRRMLIGPGPPARTPRSTPGRRPVASRRPVSFARSVPGSTREPPRRASARASPRRPARSSARPTAAVHPSSSAGSPRHPSGRPRRSRWHHEQKCVDRAPMTIRLTGRPQRGHGSPVRW